MCRKDNNFLITFNVITLPIMFDGDLDCLHVWMIKISSSVKVEYYLTYIICNIISPDVRYTFNVFKPQVAHFQIDVFHISRAK